MADGAPLAQENLVGGLPFRFFPFDPPTLSLRTNASLRPRRVHRRTISCRSGSALLRDHYMAHRWVTRLGTSARHLGLPILPILQASAHLDAAINQDIPRREGLETSASFRPSRLVGQNLDDRSGRIFLVHDSGREAGVITPADFRDEVAEFAVVFVLFQARVCLGIIRLQADQFIARFLTRQAGVRDLFSEVSPSIQRLHTNAQEPFIVRTKRHFIEQFTFHVLHSYLFRSKSHTKAAKSQVWRNLLQEWFFYSAVPVRSFAPVFRLTL